MPSPIAHSAVGYVVYRLHRRRFPALDSRRFGPVPWLLAIAVVLSLLPDIDSVAGLLAGDFGRYHNNLTHSVLVAAGVALATGVAGAFMGFGKFADWISLALSCYGAHILMDAATIGKGVMAFWPLTDERLLFPISLFFGFHWSEGWLNRWHWWTAATELVFAGLVLFMLRRRTSRNEGWR